MYVFGMWVLLSRATALCAVGSIIEL